jgi:hypothetical protein
MFKDLIKFTAKVGIFAAIVVWVILPNVPGMPKPGDLFHLPPWQDVAKFVLDPADLIGKGHKLQDWVHSKMPDFHIAGYHFPKPTFTPPNIFNKDKSDKDKAKEILDPGGILPKV